MARTHAAMTNGGWQPHPNGAADQDPRGRAAAPGQRPAQAAPGGHGAQGGYPAQHDPQGYHYPQQASGAPAPGPRQGLSSLEGAGPQEFAPYPNTRPAYGAGPQQPAGQPRFGVPAGDPGVRQPAGPFAGQPRQPDPMAGPAGGYDQWQAPMPSQGGYDLGNYMPAGAGHGPMGDPAYQQPSDWGMPAHGGFGDPQDPAFQAAQMGYEQVHAGALEQAYTEEGGEYDAEEPRRGSWALRIAGAIVVAIGLGYGLAQVYKLAIAPASNGVTPVVRGDDAPMKTKPSDPGGKQFAHTDSKVMGRLQEGGPTTASVTTASSASTDTDSNGARKVTTLVVGRDGSIQPPDAPASEPGDTSATVALPGVTMVDTSGRYPSAVTTTAAPAPSAPASPPETQKPVVVAPPQNESGPVTVATASPPAPEPSVPSASPPPEAALPPSEPPAVKTEAPPAKKTAAAAPSSTAPAASTAASNGYVVVLASVPASNSSRLAALKRFADMQQQYGSVLQNKTPDVKEANLGQKGIYHRLLVGPPGSRAQASALCSELKTAGYKDCWVTAY